MDRLKYPVYRHRLIQIAADALLVAAAYYLAFRLRFLDASGGIPERYDHMLANSIGFVVVGQLFIFYVFGLYEKWWRYFRLPDMIAVLRACAISTAILAITFLLLKPFDDQIPRSVVVSDFLLTVFLVGGARLLARMVLVERLARRDVRGAQASARRRRRLGRADGGARAAAQPEPRARRRSASWTTIRASAGCGCTASTSSARPRRSGRSSTSSIPTR